MTRFSPVEELKYGRSATEFPGEPLIYSLIAGDGWNRKIGKYVRVAAKKKFQD